jgi:hypothetical protein
VGVEDREQHRILKSSFIPISAAAVDCLFMADSCRPLATGAGKPSSHLSDLKGPHTAGNREAAFAERIQTRTVDRVTVSACLLPDEEKTGKDPVELGQSRTAGQ